MSHDSLFGLRIGASRIGEEFCRYVVGENAVWNSGFVGHLPKSKSNVVMISILPEPLDKGLHT